MNFSTAQLIKSSARQLCYFQNRPKYSKPATKNQKKGEKHQEKVTVSGLKEMRGVYEHGDLVLFFCIDEIQDKDNETIFIEHKMVNGIPEEWYYNSSILQTAVYRALALAGKPDYYTASFLIKQGADRKKFTLDKSKKFTSILQFGNKRKRILLKKYKGLIDFYVRKAKASQGWDTAQLWDDHYKHKEYEQLKKHIIIK